MIASGRVGDEKRPQPDWMERSSGRHVGRKRRIICSVKRAADQILPRDVLTRGHGLWRLHSQALLASQRDEVNVLDRRHPGGTVGPEIDRSVTRFSRLFLLPQDNRGFEAEGMETWDSTGLQSPKSNKEPMSNHGMGDKILDQKAPIVYLSPLYKSYAGVQMRAYRGFAARFPLSGLSCGSRIIRIRLVSTPTSYE